MKAIKRIGPVALTALMVIACVGASSAIAESTELCEEDESPCEAKNIVTSVHEASVGKAKLLTSLATIECNVLFSGEADEVTEITEEGAPAVISGSFTYTNCESGGNSCTATEENGPATLEVLKTGHETAEVTSESLVHFVCGKTIDCSYIGTGLIGKATGPLLSTQENGEVTISGQKATKETGGFLCPKEAKLDITTSPLTATYLSQPGGDYCLRFQHQHGFYLAFNNGRCQTRDLGRSGFYELMSGPPGLIPGDVVCVRMIEPPFTGLYKVRGCPSDKDDPNNGSFYELGTVQ